VSTKKLFFGNFESKDIWSDESEYAHNPYNEPTKKDEDNYVRTAATSTTLLPNHPLKGPVLKQNIDTRFQPVYSDGYNKRLANAYEFDYTIRGGINRLVFFILGKTDSIKTTLYPNIREQIQSEYQAKGELSKIKILKKATEAAQSAIESQFTDQEQIDLQKNLDNIDRVTGLYPSLPKPIKSAMIFGRSALWIDRTPDAIESLNLRAGAPIALKPLNSQYLGQVKINESNWNIVDVEYKDPGTIFTTENADPIADKLQDTGFEQKPNTSSDGITWLPIKDLIYFTRDDDNIVGDSLHYGLSSIQPILSLSEENRRINQRVMPELNESMWCGSRLWTFPGWSESDIANFLKTIKPGKNITVNSPDVDVKDTDLKFDYPSLLNVRESNEKKILAMIGIPDFLVNIRSGTAQKNAGDELIAFQEGILEYERAWIRDILDEYWYQPLLQSYFPGDEFIHIKLKVVTNFKNISFESFFEKALALETLVSNKLMTPKEARELLSLPVIDDIINPPQIPDEFAQPRDLASSGGGSNVVSEKAPILNDDPKDTKENLQKTQSRPPQSQLQNKANKRQAKRLTKPF
jgi:hypothetical protein